MFGTMENSPTEFSIGSPTSEFQQSVEVRTDAKSESGVVEGFPSRPNLPGRRSKGFVTRSCPTKSADLSGKKRRKITADFQIWEVLFGP